MNIQTRPGFQFYSHTKQQKDLGKLFKLFRDFISVKIRVIKPSTPGCWEDQVSSYFTVDSQ